MPVQGLSLNENDSPYIIFHTHLLEMADIQDLKRVARHHDENMHRAKVNGWVEQSGESPYANLAKDQNVVEGTLQAAAD